MFVYQVFFACQNYPEVLKHSLLFFLFFHFGTSSEKKRYFVEKIPILGEGGGVFPRGNFSHVIPFFLKTLHPCQKSPPPSLTIFLDHLEFVCVCTQALSSIMEGVENALKGQKEPSPRWKTCVKGPTWLISVIITVLCFYLIASPSTYTCEWVGQWFIVSVFWVNFCIFQACKLVVVVSSKVHLQTHQSIAWSPETLVSFDLI